MTSPPPQPDPGPASVPACSLCGTPLGPTDERCAGCGYPLGVGTATGPRRAVVHLWVLGVILVVVYLLTLLVVATAR